MNQTPQVCDHQVLTLPSSVGMPATEHTVAISGKTSSDDTTISCEVEENIPGIYHLDILLLYVKVWEGLICLMNLIDFIIFRKFCIYEIHLSDIFINCLLVCQTYCKSYQTISQFLSM